MEASPRFNDFILDVWAYRCLVERSLFIQADEQHLTPATKPPATTCHEHFKGLDSLNPFGFPASPSSLPEQPPYKDNVLPPHSPPSLRPVGPCNTDSRIRFGPHN